MPSLYMEKGRDLRRTNPKACMLRGQKPGALFAQLFQQVQGESKTARAFCHPEAMTSSFFSALYNQQENPVDKSATVLDNTHFFAINCFVRRLDSIVVDEELFSSSNILH